MNTLVLLLPLLLLAHGCVSEATVRQLSRVSHDGVVYAAAPQERGAYAVGTPGGSYNYGYNTGDGIAKVEVRQADGSIFGSYRYFDPNGKQVVRSYVADKRGFRVLGNDLPISPDTPASQVAGSPVFTGAVEGTDEFAIPPPLRTSFLTPRQRPMQHQLQFQVQQTDAYRRQLQQLEEQRRQLRIQQEKLEALQRVLERQEHDVKKKNYQIHSRPRYHYSHTPDHLTGGFTAPYYYFRNQLNYDFPAGFAFTGLPTYRAPPPKRIQYPEAGYIIGQAR